MSWPVGAEHRKQFDNWDLCRRRSGTGGEWAVVEGCREMWLDTGFMGLPCHLPACDGHKLLPHGHLCSVHRSNYPDSEAKSCLFLPAQKVPDSPKGPSYP